MNRVSPGKRLSAYYKAFSNEILWPLILPLRQQLLKRIARRLSKDLSGGLVLDIGTGYGFLPAYMAGKNPNLRIIGIDISPVLIADANQNAEFKRMADRVRFFSARAENLPFKDNTFDTILSTMSFHQWENQQQGLSEVQRVLKPGGKAVIFVGSYYLAHGLEHLTDFFTKRSHKAMNASCETARFADIKIDRVDQILRIKATK
jgi:ubiquinone/menaquinone biosynthesis C-methylase UbiE